MWCWCSIDETKRNFETFYYLYHRQANTKRGLHCCEILRREEKRFRRKIERDKRERERKDVDSKDITNDGEVCEEERKSLDDDDGGQIGGSGKGESETN